jgi:hypothetical protein
MLRSLRSLAFFGCVVVMVSSGCGYIGLDVENDDGVSLDDLDGMGGADDENKDEDGGSDGVGVGGSKGGADGSGGDEAVGGADGTGGDDAIGGGTAADGGSDGTGGDDAIGGGTAADGGSDGTGGDDAIGGGTAADGGSDGTGGLAGTGGAGSSNEVWDAPLVECSTDCIEPVLFYEPFEDDLTGVIKEDAGAFVGYTTEVVHSGASSLVASQGEPESDAQITNSLDPGVTGDLYYRAWLYVPTGTVNDWVKILALNGSSVEGIDLNLLSNGGLEVYSQLTSDSVASTDNVVPLDEWFCLQVHADVANNGTAAVWVNEQLVINVSGWNTQPGGSVDRIVYGIAETGSNQTGATIYTDDIIAATAAIPCGPY